MARHLNLVKSDFETLEKRVLPRFPFCYLIFKASDVKDHAFEVKDISTGGMQLELKNCDYSTGPESKIGGEIHWQGKKLEIVGDVQWVRDNRIGVAFSKQASLRAKVESFLSPQNFAQSLKPLHKEELGLELPPKLKYWLRSDGPVEVFIWRHDDGELSKFQILMMENFLEWVDGQGLKTGRVISKRNVDTPLISEDEFVFKLDESLDGDKVALAKELMQFVESDMLSEDTLDFLLMKLSN